MIGPGVRLRRGWNDREKQPGGACGLLLKLLQEESGSAIRGRGGTRRTHPFCSLSAVEGAAIDKVTEAMLQSGARDWGWSEVGIGLLMIQFSRM